jgi:tRNA threonylcarbamoyladenosine biosynthesis protein TsaB
MPLPFDMRILAMDTSAGACSAALRDDGGIVERVEEMQRGHAEALMPMIISVMREAGRQFRDLDLVAVTVGPGAFTGLRVGLAAARGIALAAGLPCFGVTTLEVIAEAIDWPTLAHRPALVVLDNRQGGAYAQLYQADRALEPASIQSIQVLVERHAGAPIAVAGDVPPPLIAALRALGSAVEAIAVPPYPTAGRVAAIAARRWLAGERPSAPPAPLYLQPPTTGPARAAAG